MYSSPPDLSKAASTVPKLPNVGRGRKAMPPAVSSGKFLSPETAAMAAAMADAIPRGKTKTPKGNTVDTSNPRVRRWVVTLWDPTPERMAKLEQWYEANKDEVAYIAVGAHESTEKGEPHCHALVCLKNAVYRSFFKRTGFNDCGGRECWFQPERNAEAYEQYMTKNGALTLTLGTSPTSGRATVPAGAKATEALERYRELYDAGGLSELARKLTPQQYQHAMKVLPLIQDKRPERLAKIKAYVESETPNELVQDLFMSRSGVRMFNVHYFGPSGRGKSLLARSIADEIARELRPILFGMQREIDDIAVYTKMSNKFWFDGFEQQAVLLLDDWRPNSHGASFSSTMALFDRYSTTVEIKGGVTNMNTVSVFTTAIHPLWDRAWDEMFRNEERKQIYRRIPFAVDISCLERSHTDTSLSDCDYCVNKGVYCPICVEEHAPACKVPSGVDVKMLCCHTGRLGGFVRGCYLDFVKPVLDAQRRGNDLLRRGA